MSKSVLIISTSPRKSSNSDALAEEFARGALEAGNQVEKSSFMIKQIGFCKGCLACQKTKRCVIHDDADIIGRPRKCSPLMCLSLPRLSTTTRCAAK